MPQSMPVPGPPQSFPTPLAWSRKPVLRLPQALQRRPRRNGVSGRPTAKPCGPWR